MTLVRILALALALSACGPAPTLPVPSIEATSFAPALGVDLAASTKLPNGQYFRDKAVGTGTLAAEGSTLQVYYSGWLADGTAFDSNVASGTPFAFHYARGEVIRGWDHGFTDMKVGGTRQLVLPPALAYGAAGAPPRIPSNAILVFDVMLVSVQ